MTEVLMIVGLALLILGAELLVRGASGLALTLGLSPLVIGLTIVSAGTSSPEIAVSLQGSISGETDLVVGNVVGSNIANILLILGLTSLFVPLTVTRRVVRLYVPLMIAVSIVVAVLADNHVLGKLEGLVLIAALAIYLGFTVVLTRRQQGNAGGEESRPEPDAPPKQPLLGNVLMTLSGLGLLVAGSRWLVDGASSVAVDLGLSSLIAGLVIVAVGTSLPEVVTSLVAALRGQRDMAVGNAVGSNLFNLLGVLGLSAVVSSGGLGVPDAAVRFDIPVMLAAAIACLPIFFNGIIGRREGALFLGYYAAYVAYLVLDATGHDALDAFSTTMLVFVIPPTILALAASFFWGTRWRGVGE